MKKHLTIESATHVLVAAFTLSSWANVNSFLLVSGHNHLAAALLSAALGASLAIVALCLTKIDMQVERQAFWALVAVGLGLGALSGALQAAEYHRHLGIAWAVVLGFTPPLLGEVGLSIASALFSKAQSRSELRAVHSKMSSTVTAALDDALATFDTSAIRRRIDKSLNEIASRAVAGVTSELLAFYGTPATETSLVDTNEATIPHVVPTPDQLSAARSAKKEARMGKVLSLIRTGELSLGQIASQVSISEKTVDRYIAELRSDGHPIHANGTVKLMA